MSSSFEALVRQLPFHLDDVKEANASFEAWILHGREQDRRVADLWTYCYVRRYFMVKFTRVEELPENDFDILVGEAYERIQVKRGAIRTPDRYANWVSVICRNTFVSYLRRQRREIVATPIRDFEAVAEPDPEYHDLHLVQQVLVKAIGRLPGFLSDVARMRFLEQKTYLEISALMEKKVAVVRSYAHKAVLRLRKDPGLRAFYNQDHREDYENE